MLEDTLLRGGGWSGGRAGQTLRRAGIGDSPARKRTRAEKADGSGTREDGQGLKPVV